MADITPSGVLSLTGVSVVTKTYDGTTVASLDFSSAVLSGAYPGDDVGLDLSGVTAEFASADAGDPVTVTMTGLALTGDQAHRYAVPAPSLAGVIQPRALRALGFVASNRAYNGSVDVTVDSSSAVLDAADIVGSDMCCW